MPKELSVSKNKILKIQEILVDNFKNLQLAPHVVKSYSHTIKKIKDCLSEGVLLRHDGYKILGRTYKILYWK